MTSTTADRWPVRIAARWIARVDGVSAQLRLAMLALTGISTATITLKQYGHGNLAWPFITILTAAVIVYTYLYTEGGVWNQVRRDKADMSDNYSGPTMLLDRRIHAAQLALLGHYLRNGENLSLDDLESQLQGVTENEWRELRDGIPPEALE